MHYFLLLFLTHLLYANQPFSKEITLKPIDDDTILRLKFDPTLYQYTRSDFGDIRIYTNQDQEIGYAIKKVTPKRIVHNKTLQASFYDRKSLTLTYVFKQPFLVQSINFDIKSRNFSTAITLHADGKRIVTDYGIYDYSSETGNRNFGLKIPSVTAKKITLSYDLKKTHFYSSYKYDFKKAPRPLKIMSATFTNSYLPKITYDKTIFNLQEQNTTQKNTLYLFKTNYLETSYIKITAKQKNYKREGAVYGSNDKKKWQWITNFTIKKSSFEKKQKNHITLNTRKRYLKLVMPKHNNTPLTIEHITAYTQPNYLYFIASPNQHYRLYFGDNTLKNPSYDVASLIKNNAYFTKATTGSLQHHKITPKTINFFEENKMMIFTLGILFAVGILLYIAFGLLKQEDS